MKSRKSLALSLLGLSLAACLEAAPQPTLAAVRHEVVRARIRGQEPVVVFDLDDTIFVAGSRTRSILEHFARSRRPDLVERFVGLDYLDLPYLVTDTLDRVGVRDEATRKQVVAYWKQRFFDNFWPVADVPMRGAPDFVRLVHRLGAHVVYLTGRDEPGMGKATRRSLSLAGYPVEGGRVHFLLKPNFEMEDEVFKADALATIEALGEVVATFENEPGNARLFLERFPEARHVLVGDRHRPDAPPAHPDLIRIEDFR